ncbi:acetyl-CoA synthetase-like protein [Agrocybe pediades]|nr:acetyl-CoA synthetase-like protein [Agrocybe pediades]
MSHINKLESSLPQNQNPIHPAERAMSRTIPDPPRTQGSSSSTFLPPALDGSLSLPEQYEWHLAHSPNHPLFIYADKNKDIRTVFWGEAVKAIHAGTRIIRQTMEWAPGIKNTPVIAILASSDSITYFITLMSILRAGYIVFPISPRNSSSAVAHLISMVNAECVLVGRDPAMSALANDALNIMTAHYTDNSTPALATMPAFQDLFVSGPGAAQSTDDIPFEKRDPGETILYIHSSGSTAFPKPIPWTAHQFAQLALTPYFGERNLTGTIWSLHVMPMFHGMGIMQLCLTASTGHILSVFEPASTAIAPTPKNHFEAAFLCKSDIVFSVPAIIEAWSYQPEYVAWLATRSAVLYGGGPLNKGVGDYLTSKGIPIFALYGCSEGGIMSLILPAAADKDWDYFRFSGNIKPEMIHQGDGTYELVMVNNPFCELPVINTKVNDVDAYATSDLLIEHPEKPGHWKIYGRVDDQIMHSTGEKTNPGPLESIINQDPCVQSSVMFGRGRFNAGILVEPKVEFRFDPSDEAKLADFRNKIWPAIQRVNSFAPQHSRIFKEMILVTKPSTPFQYTAKNTPRRHMMINSYDEEIQAAYNAVSNNSQSEIPSPTEWDLLGTYNFVRSVVHRVLPHNVDDKVDIFQNGCDSLQATWIRNTLLRALRDSAQIDTRSLVDNFVYEHPTITSLSLFVNQLAAGGAQQREGDITPRKSAMLAMVEKHKYQTFSTTPHPNVQCSQVLGDVVLVTGTTGGLGSYLLAELISNPAVSRVYALNRAGTASRGALPQRQLRSLVERGLEGDSIMRSEKLVLVEANLNLGQFGLADELYNEMVSSVAHILHNAWPVDFNLSLASFESNVEGLRNLIAFALSSPRPSPPTLVFTSSIGVLQNPGVANPVAESRVAPEVAAKTGYTESKWVSEEILVEASKRTQLNSIIVRVGQLCGGLNGCWNTAEWFPSLIQSAQTLGCIPTGYKVIDWIPLDLAAKALVDYRLSGKPGSSTILHLTHPKPVAWSKLATAISRELSVEPVPFIDWFKKLEQAKGSMAEEGKDIDAKHTIAALRLLPFFGSMSSKVQEGPYAFGLPCLSNCTALRLSPALSDRAKVIPLQEKDALLWLGYWKGQGFIKTSATGTFKRQSLA